MRVCAWATGCDPSVIENTINPPFIERATKLILTALSGTTVAELEKLKWSLKILTILSRDFNSEYPWEEIASRISTLVEALTPVFNKQFYEKESEDLE